MNNTDSEFQLICKIILVTIGAAFGSIFVLKLVDSVGNSIEDYVKYNRYKQEVQEYRECAKNQKDEFSARSFCGDAPSSIGML